MCRGMCAGAMCKRVLGFVVVLRVHTCMVVLWCVDVEGRTKLIAQPVLIGGGWEIPRSLALLVRDADTHTHGHTQERIEHITRRNRNRGFT